MPEATSNKERVIYLDILRVLAILFVMLLHISAEKWFTTDVNSYEWGVMNIYNSLTRWSVPVFVMISGYLFLSRDISIEQLYKKNILKMVIIFIVWSLGYALFFYNPVKNGMSEFIKAFTKGHYHMWFIYMIIGLYMIVPFLKKISEDEKMTEYFITLAFIFAFVIPEIVGVMKIYAPNIGEWTETVINQMHLKMVLGYSGYYLLGYYLGKRNIDKKGSAVIYILGVIGIVATALLSVSVSRQTQAPNSMFYDYLTVNVVLEAVAVFILIKNIVHSEKIAEKDKNIIANLSKFSLGAYLIHPFVIAVIGRALGLTSITFNPALSIPLITLMTVVFSFSASALLNQIPIIKKYLV